MLHTDSDKFLNQVSGSCLLGIDFGMQKIGIAVGYIKTKLAIPITVIQRKTPKLDLEIIASNIKQFGACGILIGAMYDGKTTKLDKHLERFICNLYVLNMPIMLVNEENTTKIAQHIMRESGMVRKIRDAKDDMIAASIMLEIFLNNTISNL